MPPKCQSYRRRTTTYVLVAVALVSGGVLLLGDSFGATPSYPQNRAARVSVRIAACVADENMRLIDPNRERCHLGEIELVSRG
jgi:hypothetical protein